MDGPASQSFHFAMRVGPKWSNVERMRTAVLHSAEAVFGPGDASEVVSTVTSELMENAVKYGDWSPPDRIWLRVAVVGGLRSLRINVECPIDESSPHLANLTRMLAWIDGFPDPRDAYRTRIQEIVESGEPGAGGMGLVRIAGEGPCKLSARIVPDRLLVVSAIVDLARDSIVNLTA
jgi:anti-sigma regulatory factor (Ser/Thr protein kinase)